MRNRRGRWLVFCFLIGIPLVFGLSLPAAGQPPDAIFSIHGESPFEVLREVNGLDPGEYTLSAEIYDTQANLWSDGLQEEPPQPGMLWLYILMGAIITVIGGTIVYLIKSRPVHSRPIAPSDDWASTGYEPLPAEEIVDQTQTELQEVEAVYMTANAPVGNGAFERADNSALFDQATVDRSPGVLAHLIVKHTSGQEQKYHLFESNASIGRGKDVYIMLLDNKVSRHHADICYEDGEYIFVDNQPSNPSHINGELYSGAHIIRDNDEFIIGETRIVFKSV